MLQKLTSVSNKGLDILSINFSSNFTLNGMGYKMHTCLFSLYDETKDKPYYAVQVYQKHEGGRELTRFSFNYI